MLRVSQSFDHQRHPDKDIPSGYALPEPAVFANHEDEEARQMYMKTYLKLREVTMYQIANNGVHRSLRRPAEWRTLLGLELHGSRMAFDSKQTTRAAEERRKLVAGLQESFLSNKVVSSLSSIFYFATNGFDLQNLVDLNNLSSVVAWWNGQAYPGQIPDHIYRLILADIFAWGFKCELIFADSIFYKLKPAGFDKVAVDEGEVLDFDPDLDASSLDDREVKVTTWLPGFTGKESFGFNDPELLVRQRVAYKLYRVMCGWGYMPSMAIGTHNVLARLAPECIASEADVSDGLHRVTFHYVASFADYFQRAPLVPHAL